MKAFCLASSSSGNCYILEFNIKGVPTRIMVECGIPYKEILSRSNQYSLDISTVKCCLITHAHGDHCKAAKDINRIGITIYAHPKTLDYLNVEGEELKEFEPKTICDGIKVMSFPVEHDIDGAVGFVIKTKEETVIFINDHKRWMCDLSTFKPDYIFIECNYDHKVVYAQIHELKKLEPSKENLIKISQHERNLNSHCSLHGTIKGLEKLNTKQTKCIFLMHLSDRYANEYRMKNEVQSKIGVMTYVCFKNGGIK